MTEQERANTLACRPSEKVLMVDGDVVRTVSGETVLSFPVVAYIEDVETVVGPVERVSFHWSTPGASALNVRRLFDEASLRAAYARGAADSRLLAATPAASPEVRERVARAIREAPMRRTLNGPRIIDQTIELTENELLNGDAAIAAIRPGDRLPAGVVVPEEPTEALLSELGKRRRWTLSYKCPFYADDDDQEQCWQVTEVRGGVNDREWYVLGKGETPADAIRAAIAAAKETTR